MRFRKRIKVIPGFYLNFSSSGVSSTIGIKGASINISKKGTYLNTSIPGTGFYNRIKLYDFQGQSSTQEFSIEPEVLPNSGVLIGEIKSSETDKLTSANLIELKETLNEIFNDRIELQNEIDLIKKKIANYKTGYVITCILIVGFFLKSFKQKIKEKEEYLIDLTTQLKNSIVNIGVSFDEIFNSKYIELINSYKLLLTSEVIWDITSSITQDRKITRSAASNVITRVPVKFKFDNIDIIQSNHLALHFENKNGGDLYIYPAFVIITKDKKEFALIDIKKFKLAFSAQRFLEEETIPRDTKIIDKTWAYVNKNGNPDRRFSNNYEIPIVRYGRFDLSSNSGLNESYSCSNYELAEKFSKAFHDYQNSILHFE